jgi:hypothetical protein
VSVPHSMCHRPARYQERSPSLRGHEGGAPRRVSLPRGWRWWAPEARGRRIRARRASRSVSLPQRRCQGRRA